MLGNLFASMHIFSSLTHYVVYTVMELASFQFDPAATLQNLTGF